MVESVALSILVNLKKFLLHRNQIDLVRLGHWVALHPFLSADRRTDAIELPWASNVTRVSTLKALKLNRSREMEFLDEKLCSMDEVSHEGI